MVCEMGRPGDPVAMAPQGEPAMTETRYTAEQMEHNCG
jgi:hypothetical protein